MRTFVVAVAVLLACTAAAATLEVEVQRQGFAGPLEVAIAPRVDGRPPEWASTKTVAAGKSSVRFDGLTPGLYIVLASGPQPLQRLSAKANVGSDGAALRLVIPQSTTELRATLAGEPISGAEIIVTHEELGWHTEFDANEDGRFAGDLWEPGVYTIGVRRDRLSAYYSAEAWLSSKATTIEVPDRHVTGRVLANGKPLANAIVNLRSETLQSTLTIRTQSAPDGHFEFFGVREGAMTLTARAPSYLDSDPIAFENRGTPARKSADIELLRGAPRAVRVVDARNAAIAGATLFTSCGGFVKSMSMTDAQGQANVAVAAGDRTCAIYAIPKEGSIGIAPVQGEEPLVIRVPDGTSSLKLALQSDAGEVFSAMSLLMRVDGVVIPPAIARLLGGRGFLLMTNEKGNIALERIPPGTYEFWPYRTAAEGQMLYETASEFEAPIAMKVVAGENHATVRFSAR